jgi:hypothetical protein
MPCGSGAGPRPYTTAVLEKDEPLRSRRLQATGFRLQQKYLMPDAPTDRRVTLFANRSRSGLRVVGWGPCHAPPLRPAALLEGGAAAVTARGVGLEDGPGLSRAPAPFAASPWCGKLPGASQAPLRTIHATGPPFSPFLPGGPFLMFASDSLTRRVYIRKDRDRAHPFSASSLLSSLSLRQSSNFCLP